MSESSQGPGLVCFPNPSSQHAHGRLARGWLEDAREKVAASLGQGVRPEQLVFTGSGTEASQTAIAGTLTAGSHWITTDVEHPATLAMRERFTNVSVLPVDAQGRPRAELLRGLLRPETALVSVIWVNNETGVISDVPALKSALAGSKALLHLDGAQAWGKLPISLNESGAELVSFAGHKIGALPGTGVLYIRGEKLAQGPLMPGHQEQGRRGGTPNLPGAIALGAAASGLDPEAWAREVAPLRDRLETAILEKIPGSRANGSGAPRVANTLSVSFDGIETAGLVMHLDLEGYSVSSGSACASGLSEPSHVLTRLGLTRAQALASVRVSLPGPMRWETLEGFLGALERSVARLRASVRLAR